MSENAIVANRDVVSDDHNAGGATSLDRTAKRSEVVMWESAAWAVTGVVWVVAAWPGLLVSWDNGAGVPIAAVVTLAVFVAWQVVRGSSWSRPSSWAGSRVRRHHDLAPKSRRALAIAVAIDAVLWAGSGVAWCAAARYFNWSESLTGASIQMGVGIALIVWAGFGVLGKRRIIASDDDPVVVKRRILGTGPLTVAEAAATTQTQTTQARSLTRLLAGGQICALDREVVAITKRKGHPDMAGTITTKLLIDRINITSDHLADLVAVDVVEAVAGNGLRGDRHFGNAARQVTIQSREELALASERLGRPIDADLTRRNITVGAGLLDRTRGNRIVVGDATLEVFADAAPCKLMDELHGPGARVALKKLAGVHYKVITGGRIRIGDSLQAIDGS